MIQYTKSTLVVVIMMVLVSSSMLILPTDAFQSTTPLTTTATTTTSSLYHRRLMTTTRTYMAVVDIDSEAAFDKTIKSAGDSLVVVDYSTTWYDGPPPGRVAPPPAFWGSLFRIHLLLLLLC
jgi:hypothetical protein